MSLQLVRRTVNTVVVSNVKLREVTSKQPKLGSGYQVNMGCELKV